jgi:hypothetical protein
MKKLLIAAGAVALGIVVLPVLGVLGYRVFKQHIEPVATRQAAVQAAAAADPAPAEPPPPADTRPATEADRGFIYGRVTTTDGTTYQGRLRFGGDREAFWGDTFNGVKRENPWLAQLAPEQIPKQTHSIEIFGWKLGDQTAQLDVTRQLTARFGEIARIEAQGKDVRVTLKSGSVVDVNRFDASDFDDGVRVWDASRGAPHLDSMRIRSIELLPTVALADPPARLFGTVRSRRGDFTGFIEWDREECVGTDEIEGQTGLTEQHVRFDTIRSIERGSHNSSRVTLTDGREVELSSTNDVGDGNRGILVDDLRYGRVVVSWDAFERVDFAPGDSGPANGDFTAGSDLHGTVTTRDGRRVSGRLVYDLDESKTTETLDGSFEGVDYLVPFGMIASIVPSPDHPARLTLHDGTELQLEWDGDVGEQNAGVLVFVDGGARPDYVRWSDVARVDLDRPPAM